MARCGQYIAVYLYWRFLAFEIHIGSGVVLQPIQQAVMPVGVREHYRSRTAGRHDNPS